MCTCLCIGNCKYTVSLICSLFVPKKRVFCVVRRRRRRRRSSTRSKSFGASHPKIFITHVFTKYLRKYVLFCISRSIGNLLSTSSFVVIFSKSNQIRLSWSFLNSDCSTMHLLDPVYVTLCFWLQWATCKVVYFCSEVIGPPVSLECKSCTRELSSSTCTCHNVKTYSTFVVYPF